MKRGGYNYTKLDKEGQEYIKQHNMEQLEWKSLDIYNYFLCKMVEFFAPNFGADGMHRKGGDYE